MILLALIVSIAFSPAASARQDGAAAAAPAAQITSVQDALAAVNTVESDLALLRRAVRPLFKGQLEEALPTWLDHVQTLSASGEPVAPATERVEVILDAIEARGGDVTESRTYLKAVAGGMMDDVDATDVAGLANKAKEWLVSPDGGIKLGLNILFFVLIIILAKIISKIAAGIVSRALNKVGKGTELLRDFLSHITGQTIFIIGVVVAVGRLGVPTGPFLAVIGAAGFVIGFALQGTLSNFAAGVMILLYRPYDIGDVVTAGGVTGKVQAMTLVSTTLLTPDNQINIVPNGSIWGNVITNVTGNNTRRVDMKFGIGYGDDVAKAEKVLLDIVSNHPKVLQDPAPVIKLQELADSSVNFVVRPWSATPDYWDVFFDVHREVKIRFDAEGIGIPFPQMDVHMHNAD